MFQNTGFHRLKNLKARGKIFQPILLCKKKATLEKIAKSKSQQTLPFGVDISHSSIVILVAIYQYFFHIIVESG